MKVTIIFGTNSGATQVVSEYIATLLEKKKHIVKIVNVKDASADDLSSADLTIFGSCTWEHKTEAAYLDGQLQEHFLDFKNSLKGVTTPEQKYAVFALGDSTLYRNFGGAADHLEDLVKKLKGKLVVSPLKIDNYFFEPEQSRVAIKNWLDTFI